MLLRIPQTILLSTAYSMIGPILQTIVPYRLRGLGTALGAIYVFFVGATGGALLAALLTNSFGSGHAVIVLLVPSTLIGGLLILRSASFVRNDLSTDRGGIAGRARRDGTAASRTRSNIPVDPGQPHRFLLRPGAGPFRRRIRGPPRRGARVARHQRRRQVDGAAGDRRARYPVARSCSAERSQTITLAVTGAPYPARNSAAAGWQGRLRR